MIQKISRINRKELFQEATSATATANEVVLVISNTRLKNQIRQRSIRYMDAIHQFVHSRLSGIR